MIHIAGNQHLIAQHFSKSINFDLQLINGQGILPYARQSNLPQDLTISPLQVILLGFEPNKFKNFVDANDEIDVILQLLLRCNQ